MKGRYAKFGMQTMMYFHERLGTLFYTTEEGFIWYRVEDDICYIDELYVMPNHRNKNKATDMVNAVVRIAESSGCTKIVGYVNDTIDGHEVLEKGYKAYGMKHDLSYSTGYDFLKPYVKDITNEGKTI